MKVILAYSGGLDTTVLLTWLQEKYDAEVICYCANVGQEDELDGLEQRAIEHGAVKCYVGHSMAPAGADQLSAILGAWADGIVPGITTIDHIASDVHQKGLNISMRHTEIDMTACRSAFVNSKGFGGNNATGLFLSPIQTEEMLSRRWGKNKVA